MIDIWDIDLAIDDTIEHFRAGHDIKGRRHFNAILDFARAKALHKVEAAPNRGRVIETAAQRAYMDKRFNGACAPDATSVYFFTNSASMQRERDGVRFGHTFPALLARFAAQTAPGQWRFVFHGERSMTSERICQGIEEHAGDMREGDLVVFQSGLVDCAPRIFLEHDIECVTLLSSAETAKRLVGVSRTYREQIQPISPARVYVPLERFRAALARSVDIVNERKARMLVIGGIMCPDNQMSIARDWQTNIERYNNAAIRLSREKRFTFLDFHKLLLSTGDAGGYFFSDRLHINREGQWLMARTLLEALPARQRFARAAAE